MPQTAMTSRGKKGEVTVIELERGARASARRVAESRATIPHASYWRTLSAPAAAEGDHAARHARLAAATARALAAVPALNCAYRDGTVERYSRVNVGYAVFGSGGVVMPTLFDADGHDPAELAERLRELVPAAEAGELASPALAGATCSLIAVDDGIDALAPTIVPGHGCAIAFGRPRDGGLTVGLSCDERAIDTPAAGRFLDRLAGELREPEAPGVPET